MGIMRKAATAAAVSGAATRAHNRNSKSEEPTVVYEQAPPAAAPASPSDPTAEKIQQLSELHAQGVLSDEEFAAAKAKALGI